MQNDELLELWKQFKQDTKDHRLTIVNQDTTYRNLRWGRPGSRIYEVNIQCYPGGLTLEGDTGTVVWSRLSDQLGFHWLADSEYAKEPYAISIGYWAEKVVAYDTTGKGLWRSCVKRAVEHIKDAMSDWPLGLRAELEDEVLENFYDGEEARRWAHDFDARTTAWAMYGEGQDMNVRDYTFDDVGEWNIQELDPRFYWNCWAVAEIARLYFKTPDEEKA